MDGLASEISIREDMWSQKRMRSYHVQQKNGRKEEPYTNAFQTNSKELFHRVWKVQYIE